MTLLPIYDLRDAETPEALEALLEASGPSAFPEQATLAVRQILADVKREGDEALLRYTARFDGVALTAETLRVERAQLEASAAACDGALKASLEAMIANVQAFHLPQRPTDYSVAGPHGSALTYEHHPVSSAALYVPGGTAAYPTTVVMNAVPAQIAGVERLVVLTPPGTLRHNPAVAAALTLLGIDEVYQVGGAQAIAAAAFGTATVPKVDVIVGPGNIYVALAKREVFGHVGIDAVAGPSEVAILAEAGAPADYIAADLIAQAEHDPLARCFLITTSRALAEAVVAEVEVQLEGAPRRDIAAQALREASAAIVVSDRDAIVALNNRIAPEHLQVMLGDDSPVTSRDLVAGAIFWGSASPTALGDYWAGPNHVLPTGGSARFTGPLSVRHFIRTSSLVRYTKEASAEVAEQAARIADAEALAGHAAALRLRGGLD